MTERNIKILGITFLMLANLASGYMFEDGHTSRFLLRFVTVLATIALEWELAHRVTKRLRRRYPHLRQTRKRLVRTFLLFVVVSAGTQVLTDILVDQLINRQPVVFDWMRLVVIVLQSLLFSFTTLGLFEAVFYYNRYNRSEVEKETLQRTNLQSQLDSLKGQVNPHFLFNSLNSLSALIRKDAAQAEAFVEELSHVYRYLLRSNEQQLVTLEAELDFLQSYLHLLQTRLGNNLRVHMEVDPFYLQYLLPPLSLQLLVENVVKHNIISAEQPLDLHLFTTWSDRLHVVNKLQQKAQPVHSNRVGLSNITAKYRLLLQPEVEVKQTAETFAVILPLIEPGGTSNEPQTTVSATPLRSAS